MKAKDSERLATLRLINAAIKDRDIALRASDNEEVKPPNVATPMCLSILGRMVKQRQGKRARL